MISGDGIRGTIERKSRFSRPASAFAGPRRRAAQPVEGIERRLAALPRSTGQSCVNFPPSGLLGRVIGARPEAASRRHFGKPFGASQDQFVRVSE
jgi:hypothetical protein